MPHRRPQHPRRLWLTLSLVAAVSFPTALVASVAGSDAAPAVADHGPRFALTFLFLAVLLLAAKCGTIVERWGQPAVLGELAMGVLLGNLGLIGLHALDGAQANELLAFLAELGVVILLFQIGLESNLKEMGRVGLRALLVAIIGVIVPFALGTYVVGPWLMPGLPPITYLFLGATLTATSVGITARVFKDLGVLQAKESRIVLGAAVVDDVLGLLILAVVSALATAGTVSLATIGAISVTALAFLVGSIVVGILVAPRLGRLLSLIHTGVGMKFALALSFCLVFAYLASLVGLAPIVGAFAAGLLLDPVHFRFFQEPAHVEDLRRIASGCRDARAARSLGEIIERAANHHVEDLMEGVARFLVPLFFVFTGFKVRLETLLDPAVLGVAAGVTAVAVLGKLASGLGAGRGVRRWLVGFGMVPRGEVGLIFATIGQGLGVINDQLFSVVVVMVMATTLITPPILALMYRRRPAQPDQSAVTLQPTMAQRS